MNYFLTLSENPEGFKNKDFRYTFEYDLSNY